MASEIAGDINPFSMKLIFEWEIDYFRVKSLKGGDYVESPKFTVNCGGRNIRWRMRLLREKVQPGHTEEYLIFNPCYDHPHSNTLRSIIAINTAGKEIYELQKCRVKNCSYHSIVAIINNNEQYIPRAYVENPKNGILQNTTLKFLFILDISESMIKYNGDDIQHPFEAINKYEALLTDSKFSDVSLISEGKTMNVHKCILAQSSPVFAAMFDAEMKEKQKNLVKIDDVKYDVLVEMIRFIYAGKVNNIGKLAFELTIAADKYALDELKQVCERSLFENLESAKVMEYLQLADKLRMDKLKQKVIQFIVEHASDIADELQFDLLPNDILRDICYRLAKKK
ncbi:hypothetical protein TSAR_009129 [Trichomalopsis sarcophagae]|uniref:BTB domain-containing protein n=1 Tax=Trichomalopsis sarcophagae TaxID=543379 RepID=A0A232F1N5_9HYME|nr:hypothetical protein TSAR_009129 [Trichomalopsis sarcophagae]